MKIKLESHGDGVTDFFDKKIPRLDSNRISLAVISLHSALKEDGNFYLEVFLKECKYIKKNAIRHIIDDVEICSDDYDNSDEEQIKIMRLIFLAKEISKMCL